MSSGEFDSTSLDKGYANGEQEKRRLLVDGTPAAAKKAEQEDLSSPRNQLYIAPPRTGNAAALIERFKAKRKWA
jgi:hypothetical protein